MLSSLYCLRHEPFNDQCGMSLLPAAMQYILTHPEGNLKIDELEKACGVGVVITPEQIEEAVSVLF